MLAEFAETVKHKKTPKPWGPRILRDDFRNHVEADYHQEGDQHHRLSTVAQAMTKPGRDMDKFAESQALRDLRRVAQHAPPGQERCKAWKQVQSQLRQERKIWHTKLNEALSRWLPTCPL